VRRVPKEVLVAIQWHFHQLMRQRAGRLIDEHGLALPELLPLLSDTGQVYFPIPGMYGGFRYWLAGEGAQAKLISVSACRIWGGSGQRHEVTASGARLVEEGFI